MEVIVVIQVRSDGSLNQASVRKWLNSGYILKLETSGFENKPEVESKRKKKKEFGMAQDFDTEHLKNGVVLNCKVKLCTFGVGGISGRGKPEMSIR